MSENVEAKTSGSEGATAVAETPALKIDVPEGHRIYEAMWLVDPALGRENMKKVLTDLEELCNKCDAKWVNGEKWEERRLAYPIKKKKRGLYILSHITSPMEGIAKLERQARISDLVMRVLITSDVDGLEITPGGRALDEEGRGPKPSGGGGGRFRSNDQDSRN